jgi:excisionase family DNA binding protein
MVQYHEHTVEQAAALLGLTAGTVRDLVARGRLRSRKIGKRLHLIHDDEIERYRREHLGKQGWDKRRALDYTPSRMAVWAKEYRARRQAHGTRPETPAEGE